MPDRRLIEVAFPLKQTSLDSVHEKNVRHGHISTLHIWPARRPLAACRAALIATLLPDPGDDEVRAQLLERLAGHVVVKGDREETVGGILHWGRESEPDLDWFREKIREAYGGRAPRVLDPFGGGGAIPLEAMRLGCQASAVDINPVAWFLLKCTLDYPQRLDGKSHPLPSFALENRQFMETFFSKTQALGAAELQERLAQLGLVDNATPLLPGLEKSFLLEADLAWHVRAWGQWMMDHASQELAPYYPVTDGKPVVAYLWARTVKCKNCRAELPLLKTTWLVNKSGKKAVLTLKPKHDRSGVVFGIDHDPISRKGIGDGTMSRAGATCPCCGAIMTMEDIRTEGQARRMGATMTAVVVSGESGKEYRLPTPDELHMEARSSVQIEELYREMPFGVPDESTPSGGGSGASRAFSVQGYGLLNWPDLFTSRQLLALGTFVRQVHESREAMRLLGYPPEWIEPIGAYLALIVDRLADAGSSLAHWQPGGEFNVNTFQRFALPISWDFSEVNFTSGSTGSFDSALNWVSLVCDHLLDATGDAPPPEVRRDSAMSINDIGQVDLVLTDPPYYDAIPYSDAMDFFYVWLRRSVYGLSPEVDAVFSEPLAPKWDHEAMDGELIDDESRFDGDGERSKAAYENGMARVFENCWRALAPEGRLVIVFAHKHPDAWETLVSAIIRAGFVVDGSWPIETERATRTRSISSAALASSVWLVCRKRPPARPGWDNRVLDEMRANIVLRLRQFWDAGIRGPDVVWAATGPALEAYSQYPVVKKANAPGEVMTVGEFLGHVRRMVVDFVVGRVLSSDGEDAIAGLDDLTTYYLLHRHDFGMDPAPAGACILYALSCNLSDQELANRHDLLAKEGSELRLLPWTRRKDAGYDPVLDAAASQGAETMMLPGFDPPEADMLSLPLIDQVHRLMHLWRAGDVTKVDAYLDARGLRRSPLFHQLLQALIELAPAGSEERSLLESLSNHVGNGAAAVAKQTTF